MLHTNPKKIVLIGCGRRKLLIPAKAKDLYTSPRFRLSFAYAESLSPDAIFILSAKYGLVHADRKVPPYDETLNTKSAAEIAWWAKGVLSQLRRAADPESDTFILLAGECYRRYIQPELIRVQVPLAGLPIGKQLQFLKRALALSG